MTKKEMMKEYDELSYKKKVLINGINENSNKKSIQSAIDCLKCCDTELDDYFKKFKLLWPAIHKEICKHGDFKMHSTNRWYVFTSIERQKSMKY